MDNIETHVHDINASFTATGFFSNKASDNVYKVEIIQNAGQKGSGRIIRSKKFRKKNTGKTSRRKKKYKKL